MAVSKDGDNFTKSIVDYLWYEFGDESNGQSRLTFKKSPADYERIWFHCFGTGGQAEDESKNSPDWQREDAADDG